VLNLVAATGTVTEVRVPPAPKAIVSWNARAPVDTLELIVDTLAGHRSRALPYVVFEAGARASLNGFDTVAKIDTDVVSALGDAIVAIHVTSHHPLARVAASTPPAERRARDGNAPIAAAVRELDVPASRNTRCISRPRAAGARRRRLRCCSERTASRSTLRRRGCRHVRSQLPRHRQLDVRDRVRGDARLAGRRRLSARSRHGRSVHRGRSAARAEHRVERRALPGAPLAQSDGHILVVRGFDARGDVIVNDPAQPASGTCTIAPAFARCWLDHGGVALLVAPPDRIGDLVRCANA
jgi:hypothetical protein